MTPRLPSLLPILLLLLAVATATSPEPAVTSQSIPAATLETLTIFPTQVYRYEKHIHT